MVIKDDMEDIQEAVINELITENGITNTLADGQVIEAKIADNAVTTAKIADGSVTVAKLGGDVDLGQVNDGAVTIAKIADDAVTPAKLDRAYLESSGDTILQSGNKLQLNRADNARSMKLFTDNNAGTIQTTNDPIVIDAASGRIRFDIASSEKMRIDSSGRLGLKTTAMSSFNQISGADLFVMGSGAGNQGMTIYSGNTGTGTIAFADGTTTSQQYEGIIQYDHGANGMTFYSNHAERMRIQSDGTIKISNSSEPSTPSGGGVLYVQNGALKFKGSSGTVTTIANA